MKKIYKGFNLTEFFLLSLVVALGSFLYLYKLGSLPPGLYLDEAGTGYNAYSILKTAKDEYGKFLPLAMRLFGSYTPPLYVYLSVPIIGIFNLSIFSTRLLSSLTGIVNIVIVYFLIKDLQLVKSRFSPFAGTIVFAITPWTVFFSRMGYEQNLAFLFFCLSVFLFVRSTIDPKLIVLAFSTISLATYSDFPLRFLSPLLFIGLIAILKNQILTIKNRRYLIFGTFLAILIQIPNLYLATTPAFFTKTDHFYLDTVIVQSKKISNFLPVFISYPLSFTREFFAQYSTYFSPRSLFFLPDSDLQRSTPELSVFYPWMLIPYLVGLFFIWKERKKYTIQIILLMLFITPLPGALAKQPFHIQRTLTLLLPLTLIMTIGMDRIISNIKHKVGLPVFALVLATSLIFLWRSYFILLPGLRASVWGFQYKELSNFIMSYPDKTFVIDQAVRPLPQDIAYTQLAFYLKTDPMIIQADQDSLLPSNYYHQTKFSHIHKFGNIETRPIEWGETVWRDVILVGDKSSISDEEIKLHNLTQIFEIRDPNNITIFRGFQTNPKRLKS
jgi:4-amino-4-deoxy-L-arabinose transferase-like glycosyltransferase